MELLLTLIVGGLAGWVASLIVKRDQQMGILWNIVVGILGALVANYLLAPIFGIAAGLGVLTLSSFVLTVAGAVLLLAVYNLLTRNRVR